jgi:hypothetical protein
MTTRERLLRTAVALVIAHGESGFETDPDEMATAMKAARRAGISIQEISDEVQRLTAKKPSTQK